MKNKITDVADKFEEVVEDEDVKDEEITQAEQKVQQAQQKVDEAKGELGLNTADEVPDVPSEGWTVQQVATQTREVFYNKTTGEQLELNQVLCKILNALEE